MADKLKLDKSIALYAEAKTLVPGAVAGIRRPYNFVEGEYPIFFEEGLSLIHISEPTRPY